MLTRTIINEPEKGGLPGLCVICGQKTENGYKVEFSDNFSGWPFLYSGEVLCEYCHAFVKDQSFRKRSWIAIGNKIEFVKKSELLPYILNRPKEPFFIYLTKGGQKQGWLGSLKFVNNNPDRFFVACDWIDVPVWFNSENVDKMFDLISFLREKKVSKTVLTTGFYTVFQYKKALQEGWAKQLETVKKMCGRPQWEVMVYVCD